MTIEHTGQGPTAVFLGATLTGSITETPRRLPGSVRRTSNLDTAISESVAARFVSSVDGRARDLLTRADGSTLIFGSAHVRVEVGDDGLIARVELSPRIPEGTVLLGQRLGPGFRGAIAPVLDATAGTPLALLLADLTGAPAAMRYGITRRLSAATTAGAMPAAVPPPRAAGAREPGCIAWRIGGIAADTVDRGDPPPLTDPPRAPDLGGDDSLGWHATEPLPMQHGRRRRLLDVTRAGDEIVVDAFFRDTNAERASFEVVVHEYSLHARLDATTARLRSITVVPRVLPLDECPLAVHHVQAIVGERIDVLAKTIHRRLPREESCTHLNDMIRFLADAVILAEHLPAPR